MEDDVRRSSADRYALSQAYRWKAERDQARQELRKLKKEVEGRLIHERPDSWERIEREIERGKTYTDVCVLSIVRRCRALAERSE